MNTPTVAVVGAGIGGLTAAIALRAKGIDVEIYEAAPEPRATGTALGLASNATKVLRSLGIDLTTDACCRALEPFELRTARGALIRALPGAAITAELGHPFVSIHRNDLIRTLRNAAADIAHPLRRRRSSTSESTEAGHAPRVPTAPTCAPRC